MNRESHIIPVKKFGSSVGRGLQNGEILLTERDPVGIEVIFYAETEMWKEKRILKRTITFILAIAMCFMLSACGSRPAEQKEVAEQQTEQPAEPLNVDEQLVVGNWKAYAVVGSSSSARYLTGNEYGEMILRDDRTGVLSFNTGPEQAKEAITWSHDGKYYRNSYKGFMQYSDGEIWLLLKDSTSFLIFKRN